MKKFLLLTLIFTCFFFYACKKEKTPNACFTYEMYGVGGALIIKNCSTDADHYQWDMGDGNKSYEFEPTRSGNNYWYYSSSGTYTVKLTAYSASENKTDVATQTITIN